MLNISCQGDFSTVILYRLCKFDKAGKRDLEPNAKGQRCCRGRARGLKQETPPDGRRFLLCVFRREKIASGWEDPLLDY
jgi:hypothetical protein